MKFKQNLQSVQKVFTPYS